MRIRLAVTFVTCVLLANIAKAEDESFLPPADLGMPNTSATITRDGLQLPTRPDQLPELPLDFKLPDVNQTTMSNGMRFYQFESKDLPRVVVYFIIQAGKNNETLEKMGIAELTAKTVRAGGAAGISADDIDTKLEELGSQFEIAADKEYVSAKLFSLSQNVDESLKIVSEILQKPNFDEKKFGQQKDRLLEDLRRQNDQPSDVSRREFRRIIYGPGYPLARIPTSSTLLSISLDDSRKFYDTYYRPGNIWIGFAGDITQDQAKALTQKYFGEWNRPTTPIEKVPDLNISTVPTTGVFFTRKMVAQSQIRVGHLGMARNTPDEAAVTVMNSILGTGGFSSRLMNRVRTKRGFVYGVGGGVFSDAPVGLFASVAASKSKTTVAAIQEIMDVITELHNGPISKDELEIAKKDTIFTFFTNFDTPEEVLVTKMLYDFRGYPDNYLKTYVDKVNALTVEDVQAAARKYLDPRKLVIYVLGFDKQFDKPLSTLGNVNESIIDDYSKLGEQK